MVFEVTADIPDRAAGLADLVLWDVRIGPDVGLRLPRLRALTLADGESRDITYRDLLSPNKLPALECLQLRELGDKVSTATRADRHAAVCALAPQLTLLQVDEGTTWIDPADPKLWSDMNNLTILIVVEPETDNTDAGPLISNALRHLPHSLEDLDFNPSPPNKMFGVTMRNVLEAFTQSLRSVADLDCIRLPTESKLDHIGGMAGFYAKLALKEVVAVATGKGVEVIQD